MQSVIRECNANRYEASVYWSIAELGRPRSLVLGVEPLELRSLSEIIGTPPQYACRKLPAARSLPSVTMHALKACVLNVLNRYQL